MGRHVFLLLLAMQALADNFWNFRGVHRVGMLDVGTHMWVVRRANGQRCVPDCGAYHCC